eukprot:CAMPEP_0204832952 /NCGR_PEP_ID=MMETSP1346-20131115/15238_1 /ASSEMBLY_ACC=CAM_ASM_000771 /TAXON_ID=215587 /ORGANISM="Aplanochytrium stocchinoi, Strain GSBS06" /LENGTH=758 /DNA_ID=CAMNT_0051965103 /DNA_START=43 /DNA_END=2316 /DNA_ORIENTATION=-
MGRRDPKLKVFGVALSASADELYFHGTFFSFFRTFLVGLNLVYLLVTAGVIWLTGCSELEDQDTLAIVYGSAMLVCTILSVICYYLIWNISQKGTLFEYKKREHIKYPLHGLVVLYFLEVAVNIFGIYVAATWVDSTITDDTCVDNSNIRKSLLIFWIIWIFLDIFWFLYFARITVLRKRNENETRHLDDFDVLSLDWNNRFRYWCNTASLLTCGMIGTVGSANSDHAYEEVGDVFSRFFVDTDMTLSDFASSLLLLRVEQTRRKEVKLALHHIGDDRDEVAVHIDKPSEDFDWFLWGGTSDPEKVMREAKKKKRETGARVPKFEMKSTAQNLPLNKENMEMLKYVRNYTPHMIAIYGWKLLIYMDTIEFRPFRSIPKLARLPRRSNDKRFASENDNTCHCAGSALLRQSVLTEDDIVYASFAAIEGQEVPYAVMVDHKLRSVVFTCRGTLSLPDLLTDMIIDPVPLNKAGKEWGFDGEGHYAHKGFFMVAQEIRRRLQKNRILHTLLGKEAKHKIDEAWVETQDPGHKSKNLPNCAGYDLVLSAHSLGGAIAAIVGLMLRSEFPNVKCIAYSAPGCVFDRKLAGKCKDWVISPFVGKDMVAHLSWGSLQRVRGRSLDMLRRSKTNKAKIFQTMYKKGDPSKLLYDHHEVPDTPERNAIAQQISELAESAHSKFERIEMHNPGRVLHFAKVSTSRKGCLKRQRKYEATWVENDDMQDLEISTRMLLDHFPNYVAYIINEVTREYVPEERNISQVSVQN